MIRSIELVNFRRHEKSVIELGDSHQIVAITGTNGSGKTTVLEALMFAFYGETRHGRRGVANLVRRGAEHEGMQVSVRFTMHDHEHLIVRRYEKGKHSARLTVGDTVREQSADGVTKAVTELFGTDAVGFRLATIARQKELDGLAELTPGVRRKTISRLLRLDAVQAAVMSARDVHREARTSADALAGVASVAARQVEVDAATEALTEATDAHTQVAETIAELEAKLGASAGVDAAYNAAQLTYQRLDTLRTSAEEERDRLNARLAALVVPDEPVAPPRTVDEVRAAIAEVEVAIATGRANAELAAQQKSLQQRLSAETGQREKIAAALEAAGAGTVDTDLEQARAAATAAAQKVSDAQGAVQKASESAVAARTTVQQLRDKATTADGLGAACVTCGQDISEEHRASQAEQAHAELAAAVTEANAWEEKYAAAREDLGAAQAEAQAAAGRVTDVETRARQVASLRDQLANSERAISVYTGDLARLADKVTEVDLDAAYQQKSALEAERTAAAAYETAAAAWRQTVALRADLAEQATSAAERAEAAAREAEAAKPAAELVAAANERAQLLAELAGEKDLLAACATNVAAAQAQLGGAQKLLEEAMNSATRAGEFRTRAEIAGKVATLLDAVARRMATEIRPNLEGHVASLLQQMSQGRFTAVKISDDYELTVGDHDGKFYPVSEFSGGEADLIALALRLALGKVVANRNGHSGVGFLVLDEVFGSQDRNRQESVMEALRSLKGTFGQILLISHVGAIEEVADVIIDVTRDDEDVEIARISVAA